MKRIHCIGALVMDALGGPLRQYPIPRKVTAVIAESLRFLPGGGAANSSAALAQMGVSVSAFSKVGKDPNGVFIIQSLRLKGVDVDGVCVSDRTITPFTYVGIHPDGDRTFIHTPGANRTFCLEDIDRDSLLQADFLFYQDFWALPCIDGKPGADLLAEARDRGIVTLLDECWGFGPKREVWEVILPYADYILPSLDEMIAIYPGQSPEQIIELLSFKGARNVVLKMGEEGSLVFSGGQLTRINSCVSEIVDTTGAGDCFDAGFIAGLSRGLSDVDAARVGSLAAAACIRHVGGATGIPSLESLLDVLKGITAKNADKHVDLC